MEILNLDFLNLKYGTYSLVGTKYFLFLTKKINLIYQKYII